MRAVFAGLLLILAGAPAAAQDMACPVREGANLASRPSPLDSVSFAVGGQAIKVCYSRPSLKGRHMVGGEAVPFGNVWRTGANETTKFITTAPVTVGSIAVPAGMYSLYSVPGEQEWSLIVNKSHEQWGQERGYTPEVMAQELGRTPAKVETLATPIETFTIRAEPQADGSAHLILEWETSRVRVPVVLKK
jgi:hypothetical protein